MYIDCIIHFVYCNTMWNMWQHDPIYHYYYTTCDVFRVEIPVVVKVHYWGYLVVSHTFCVTFNIASYRYNYMYEGYITCMQFISNLLRYAATVVYCRLSISVSVTKLYWISLLLLVHVFWGSHFQNTVYTENSYTSDNNGA